ncbi:CAP domain-containing protein [Priestia filamentosa]|uniref:CAP domain-containing protein n=1 Tax=Priestia filamentosa TaxID=1402861 RepID=UPI0039797FE7
MKKLRVLTVAGVMSLGIVGATGQADAASVQNSQMKEHTYSYTVPCDGSTVNSGDVTKTAAAPTEKQTKTAAPTEKQTNAAENQAESSDSSQYAEQVVQLVNKEREKQGLKPVTLDKELSDVATKKSEDMKAKGYFDHTSPTYGSPFDMMKQFGIEYKSAGENIAKGQQTPEEVMNSWMNSDGHRKNILNPSFTHMGVGYVEDGNSTYWTQMFIGK